MARLTVEDCMAALENKNRFALIHLAVARLKQHRSGHSFLVKGKNKEIVMTLREIAAGKVNYENIEKFPRLDKKIAPAVEAVVAPAVMADEEKLIL